MSDIFRVGGRYVYVRAREVRRPELHLMVTRDEVETTVVTAEENLIHVEVLERNRETWVLLVFDPPTPFYCVGFLARISAVLAAGNIDILMVSTFSLDWVMVREEDAERAVELLRRHPEQREGSPVT